MATGATTRYCARCQARLASDNSDALCRPCFRITHDAALRPPEVPVDFWQYDRLRDAITKERHIGHVVRSYRKHPYHGQRSIPQETMARWLSISQTQLSRIESGRPVYDLDRLVQWAKVLRIPPELLWFALPDEEDHVNRRQFLTAGSAATVSGVISTTVPGAPSAAALTDRPMGNRATSGLDQIELLRQEMNEALSAGAIAEATLDDWERTAIRYARATRDRPPTVLLGSMSNDLAELRHVISDRRSTSAMRRLTRVTAQLSGLMCLEFCKLDDRPAFQRWARTARLAANESGDPETISWILAQEAYGEYYGGDLLEAIDVASIAYGAARTPCVGRALAAALEARAHAAMGHDRETREALGRAESVLSQLDSEALVSSAFGYNESSFRFHEGNAYTHLHDVKAAIQAQDRALELCSRDDYTDWAMVRLDRAQCIVYSGDATGGLQYATETIGALSDDERSGIITLRGQKIIRALPAKEQTLPAALDFHEMLMLPPGNSH